MNRRQFLGGGLLGLASSSTRSLQPPTPDSQSKPFLNRWVKVQAWLTDTHPLRSRFPGKGDTGIWVDFDKLTGSFEITSPYDPIYRWPMANLMLYRDDPIPENWRNRHVRWAFPLPPADLEWTEWLGNVEAVDSTGARYRFPRYVKVTICRDIAECIDRPWPQDRRDECRSLWMDLDLMTGEMYQCPVDDPLFDSELAHHPEFE